MMLQARKSLDIHMNETKSWILCSYISGDSYYRICDSI